MRICTNPKAKSCGCVTNSENGCYGWIHGSFGKERTCLSCKWWIDGSTKPQDHPLKSQITYVHGWRHLLVKIPAEGISEYQIEQIFGVKHLTNIGQEGGENSALEKYVPEYQKRYGSIFLCDICFNQSGSQWKVSGHGVYTDIKSYKEKQMSISTAKRGDWLRVINPSNPLNGQRVKVDVVQVAQAKKISGFEDKTRSDDTYKVYLCTTEHGTKCLLSPTEVERSCNPEAPLIPNGAIPLAKVRIGSYGFRKKHNRESDTEWGLLLALIECGCLEGIKLGCQYVEVDAIQEVLDRLGALGYPMQSRPREVLDK